MRLEALQVNRELPPLLRPEDAALFRGEATKVLPAVELHDVHGRFLPTGWHQDLPGWKGAVRNLVSRTWPTESFDPGLGKIPLIVTDRFSNGYFHWLTESLTRLWALRDTLDRYTVILPSFAARFAYMEQSLALFAGLNFRVIPSNRVWSLTSAKRMPGTAPTGNYRPELVAGVGQAWRERVGNPKPTRKLAISRSLAPRRRVANEAVLNQRLVDRGFEIVTLEGRPFSEQVRLLAETEHLISNHGAGLTNMLFMAPGTRVTEIRRAGDTHNNCYFSLARALGLDYDYRLGQAVDGAKSTHDADLVVNVEDF